MAQEPDLRVDLTPLGEGLRSALAEASTSTIATVLFKHGLRNRVIRSTRRLRPGQRMVGVARTLRYVAAREDIDTLPRWALDSNPQRRIADEIEPGQVLVIEAREETACGTMGGMLVARMLARGAAGIVSDGPFRDAPFIASLDLPAYANGMNANTNLNFHHPEDLDVTITCGAVQVRPGDVIVGDDESVVVIPRYLAEAVASQAQKQEREEAYIEKLIRSGAPVKGSYPMDERTRANYQASLPNGAHPAVADPKQPGSAAPAGGDQPVRGAPASGSQPGHLAADLGESAEEA